MLISKTEKGLVALQARADDLRGRERQMLIMVDGRRTHQDFLAMLGHESVAVLSRLQQGGFIAISEPQSQSSQYPCKLSSKEPCARTAQTGSVSIKRPSMSEAKRYLVMHLSQVKDANTKRFIKSLDRCINHDELVVAMVNTLMYLQSELEFTECSDVVQSLSRIVPPHYWKRIEADLSLKQNSCC